jgi:hypothetical protein
MGHRPNDIRPDYLCPEQPYPMRLCPGVPRMLLCGIVGRVAKFVSATRVNRSLRASQRRRHRQQLHKQGEVE